MMTMMLEEDPSTLNHNEWLSTKHMAIRKRLSPVPFELLFFYQSVYHLQLGTILDPTVINMVPELTVLNKTAINAYRMADKQALNKVSNYVVSSPSRTSQPIHFESTNSHILEYELHIGTMPDPQIMMMLQDESLSTPATPLDIILQRSTYDLLFGTMPDPQIMTMLQDEYLSTPATPIDIIMQRPIYNLLFGIMPDLQITTMLQDESFSTPATPDDVILHRSTYDLLFGKGIVYDLPSDEVSSTPDITVSDKVLPHLSFLDTMFVEGLLVVYLIYPSFILHELLPISIVHCLARVAVSVLRHPHCSLPAPPPAVLFVPCLA